MPSEPTYPDDSLLSSLSPAADSANVTQARKRRCPADHIVEKPAQNSHESLVRYMDESHSYALEAAASYYKLEKEKIALKEQIGKLEHERSISKEETVVLQKHVGRDKRENRLLKAQVEKVEKERSTFEDHFTTVEKENDALEQQAAIDKDRLVSPQRLVVDVLDH